MPSTHLCRHGGTATYIPCLRHRTRDNGITVIHNTHHAAADVDANSGNVHLTKPGCTTPSSSMLRDEEKDTQRLGRGTCEIVDTLVTTTGSHQRLGGSRLMASIEASSWLRTRLAACRGKERLSYII